MYKIATNSQPGHVTKTWAISTSIISVYSRPGFERLEWVGGGGYGRGLRVEFVCSFVQSDIGNSRAHINCSDGAAGFGDSKANQDLR